MKTRKGSFSIRRDHVEWDSLIIPIKQWSKYTLADYAVTADEKWTKSATTSNIEYIIIRSIELLHHTCQLHIESKMKIEKLQKSGTKLIRMIRAWDTVNTK